jgi:hypothetical protein
LEVQARIPAALAAVHNFISIHNPHDKPISSTTSDNVRMHDNIDDEDFTSTGLGATGRNETDLRRDSISQKMWDDYVHLCVAEGIDREAGLESDLGEDDSDNEDQGERDSENEDE